MQPKLGGNELVDVYLERLRDGAKIQLMFIEKDNDKKRRFFEVRTKHILILATNYTKISHIFC